ncbi:MAG: SpoIIIAH-like family protein [Clostridium sp.]|nr:SpoIIIAH-like family protein [Clostridium sp.]MCM1547355.1 SpoIIIAH-like family protein [Ruminococcus sp.]
MKKPSVIIGKKQIILTCMTLMLGIAVYVNYALSDGGLVEKEAKSVNGEITAESSESTGSAAESERSEQADAENYGESQFVNSTGAEDYFAQARLEKMTNRDEAVQTLQTIMGGGDITEDEMVTNALAAVEVSKLIESEGNIETLIKAQGIEDCVVYLDGESAKVVVKTVGLEKAQAAAIKDIILGEVTIPAEKIRIFEVK